MRKYIIPAYSDDYWQNSKHSKVKWSLVTNYTKVKIFRFGKILNFNKRLAWSLIPYNFSHIPYCLFLSHHIPYPLSFILSSLFFIFYHLFSIHNHLYFILYLLSFILYSLSFILYSLSFILYPLSPIPYPLSRPLTLISWP